MTDTATLTDARTAETAPMTASRRPLVVDLDGTLIRGNLLLESTIMLVKRSLPAALMLPLWLLRGKAVLKAEVARRVSMDPSGIPLNTPFVKHLKREKTKGRRLVLATGSHETLAQMIADELGLFDDVVASDGHNNLTGVNKLAALRHRYGATGFDYAGNATADCPIWRAANGATVVNASPRLVAWAQRHANVTDIFPRQAPRIAPYLRALRLHQWLKNILLFAPLVAALKFTDTDALLRLVTGFFAFSFCASSVYLLNDIVDIEDDRLHPNKRRRPFASGELPIAHGLALIPVLLGASALLCLTLPPAFAGILAVYYLTTLAYSFGLKRLESIDVVTLALLYTTRIFAGGAASQLPISVWLLTFSIFLFLSLAIAKRCAELMLMRKNGKQVNSGRGYRYVDLPMLRSMGVGSGYVAAVVLAVYLGTPQVSTAYSNPVLLWVFVPVLLLWLTRIWIKTGRGEMHDDPLVFAARDRVSLAFGILCGLVIGVAL